MIKACITSMRLRTLPLSLAGIVMGIFVAASVAELKVLAVVFLALTAVLLQILSNLSNELGDTLSGTDTDARQGIHYSLQDGALTINQMKRLIAGVAVASCISGALMVYFSFGTMFSLPAIAVLILGALAIWAALNYTLGKNPYGYRGLGDISVFIFFGLATVLGGFFICSHDASMLHALLPAVGIGFFCVGVLNVNNIRDMVTDAATRTTVAIRLGAKKARIYQTVLIVLGWACIIANAAIFGNGWKAWLFMLTLPAFAFHLYGVWTRTERQLDPMLPLLVMSTFVLSILAGIGLI